MALAASTPSPWVSSDNLRAMMSNYALATSEGTVREQNGLTLVNSGVSFSAFNAALLNGPAVDRPVELQTRLRAAKRYFQGEKMPWSFWMPDEIVSPQARESSSVAIRASGLRWVAQHEGMIADELAAPLRALPALEFRRVFDRATRAHFARLSSSVFDLPAPISTAVYGQQGFWRGTMSAWVGYWEGHAVCCAATEPAAGVIGIYSVATHPGFRRRGFAESITRHALDEARSATGLHACILHATRAGQSLYRHMGFRYSTRLDVYVSS
jgi:ribosomal protein S18 acetylase RimI-like enzyme